MSADSVAYTDSSPGYEKLDEIIIRVTHMGGRDLSTWAIHLLAPEEHTFLGGQLESEAERWCGVQATQMAS